ncbi:hypothetical protein GcM3_136017 [Golovinomyces cichoracearum]|uniref:Uncharacterized protein n=1 Tax=Golovinomyces cichoracearum TaxID=62708 RepID=A0A420I2D8_9PEZI|nr:hypothetical protein GcM3_136017 [Golovinomyces cichoracearum]
MATNTQKDDIDMDLTQDQDLFRPALTNHDSTQQYSLISTRLHDNLICYVLPNNASKDAALDLAYACALACTSQQAPLSQWKNLLLTYTNIMIPGLVKKLPRGMVKMTKIPLVTINALRHSFSNYNEETQPDDYQIPSDAFNDFSVGGELPSPHPNIACDNITYCRNAKSLYAHFSLVVFLAGKLIDDANRTAITVARPKALIGKYKISGVEILNGTARISDHGHQFIHQAYLEMRAFTGECFKEFSEYSTSATTLYHDIINVNVMLLRFAKMQHAAIINKFLEAYPWASEMVELKQSLAVYGNSIKALCALPPAWQPYVNLIYGFKPDLFPRKELGPLIACAVEVESETNETMRNYYHDERYADVVDKFKSLRDSKSQQIFRRIRCSS